MNRCPDADPWGQYCPFCQPPFEQPTQQQPMTPETFLPDIPLQTAVAAHSGTSWTPEKRGEHTRAEYAATLAADYAEFALVLVDKPELAPQFLEEFARYREGFRKRYLAMLHSNARCVSWRQRARGPLLTSSAPI